MPTGEKVGTVMGVACDRDGREAVKERGNAPVDTCIVPF